MTRFTLLPLLAVTAVAAVPTASALAARGDHAPTIPATKSSIKVLGGYAYYDDLNTSHKDNLTVVVRLAGQLPRRWDGLIRAGGTLAGHGGGSIAAVHGKASKCYQFTVPLKDHRFYTNNGAKGAKASPGKYTVRMSAKDKDGNEVTSSKSIMVRDLRPGDRAGKPLGC